ERPGSADEGFDCEVMVFTATAPRARRKSRYDFLRARCASWTLIRVPTIDVAFRGVLAPMYADALLFDLDGVLVDSAECVRRVCTDWAISRGLDPASVLRVSQGRRVQDTIRAVAPHLDVDAEAEMLVALEARSTDGLHRVRGAETLIASLPPNAWAVVTSGARPVATMRLTHVGLPIPQTLITADDVQRGKPDPEGYLAAARALGRRPEEC